MSELTHAVIVFTKGMGPAHLVMGVVLKSEIEGVFFDRIIPYKDFLSGKNYSSDQQIQTTVKSPHGYVGGRKNKGITGEHLLLKTIYDSGTANADMIKAAFVDRDLPFSESSIPNYIHEAIKKSYIDNYEGDNYKLTKIGTARLKELKTLKPNDA